MEYHNCRGCTKAMRPPTAHIGEWPGTVLHGGFGYCYNCRKRQKKGLAPPVEIVEVVRPPHELDPDERKVLALLERRGLAGDVGAMLGFNDPERMQPLTDIQLMKNSLTSSVGVGSGWTDLDDLRSSVVRGSVKGRRL